MRTLSRPLAIAIALGCTAAALLGVSATSARTSAGSPLRLTGMREDPNRPGLLRLVIGFSGAGLRSNRVMARVTATPADPTKLRSASLTVSNVTVGQVPVLRTRDGTIVSATGRGADARITITPKAGRYKYLYYAIPDRGHILVLLYRSGTPAAPAYVVTGTPRRCIAFDHTHRVTGSITAYGHARGIFENQFMLGLRDGAGHRFTRTTVHVGTGGAWHGTLIYHVSRAQWGTLEAVEFSAKDDAISCIAQLAVKLMP